MFLGSLHLKHICLRMIIIMYTYAICIGNAHSQNLTGDFASWKNYDVEYYHINIQNGQKVKIVC